MPSMPDRTETTAQTMNRLPPILEEVAEIAGVDAALAIARRLGGRTMYVGKHPRAASALANVVGAKAAAVIGQHFGGAQVAWPRARGLINRLDARQLAESRGWSVPQIARHLRLTERYTRDLLQGVERGAPDAGDQTADPRQCPSCGRAFHKRRPCRVDPRQLRLPDLLDSP